ncbi:PTS glucitol/sorbitol transporter subunit IIA [Pelosinus fermentans]|uniref:PTS system glucitol/sorbitol-specific IIA component n=1 Tax=Pelosinus fermentans JBW45 TaxID=1192197 RepID=I9NQW2_9FIRM|nr:PTS glucitol/sorbitol transporter subunit IIA [Pelosinus fermentans]AJQ26735.1 PTS system glucitol/sorbitol-specific IIA component [Pelosinus fermentans JBW45]
MEIIYNTRVTNIGGLASAFYEEKLIIIFKDNAPEELADYCVLHCGNEVSDSVKQGDILVIAGQEYRIVYVGDEVQANLENLGHITLRFDGNTEGLGGSVYLEDKALPAIKIGDVISIYRE